MHGAAQKAIGKRIKEYREKCGLTQEMLAEKTDLTPNYISAVERGISFPRFEKLIAIINAIGASADQIFADVVENTPATRSSGLSKEIARLPFREQQRIFAVVETMIAEARKA